MLNFNVPQDWSAVYAAQKELAREMTLPDERYRAVLAAESLLVDLCDPKKTPRVPRSVRVRAAQVLRHYPRRYELNCAAQLAPSVFCEKMEDLHRFIAAGTVDNERK
jgi:hypothetical protein